LKEGLKHRLIGALVLIAAGLIAWPVLFDSEPVGRLSKRSEIPPAPAYEPFEIREPMIEPAPKARPRPEPAEPATPPSKPATAREPVTESPEAAKPQLDANGLPVLWAVQLGSFGNEKSAHELVRKLRKQGYHAFTGVSESSRGKYTRVYVGPKMDKNAATRLKDVLQKELGIDDAIVTRYRS
jgi:DedD protein